MAFVLIRCRKEHWCGEVLCLRHCTCYLFIPNMGGCDHSRGGYYARFNRHDTLTSHWYHDYRHSHSQCAGGYHDCAHLPGNETPSQDSYTAERA